MVGPTIDLRPDTSGPRNVAVILVLGAVLLGLTGVDALRQGMVEDLPLEQVETTIKTPNLSGDEVTVEQYEAFHDLARDNGAYALRGWSLTVGMSLVLIGAVGLYRLRLWGPRLASAGALVSTVGATVAGFRFHDAAKATMEGLLVDTQWHVTLACGVSSGLCLAVAALPLLNVRARLALEPKEEE